MNFLEKIKKYVYITLLIVSFCFVMYNATSKINRVKILAKQEKSRHESASIEKIQEKYQLIKYLAYDLDRKQEDLDLRNPDRNKYSKYLSIQNYLNESYFLLTVLNMSLDIVYFDENKGISQRESYNLDDFLKTYDLKPSDVNNRKKLIVKDGKVLYFYPGYKRDLGYIYQFNKNVLKNIKDDKLGKWSVFYDDKTYDFSGKSKAYIEGDNILVYDKDLEIGFTLESKDLVSKAVLNIWIFYIIFPMLLILFIGKYLSVKLAEKLYFPLKDILSGIEQTSENQGDVKYILNYFGELKNQNNQLHDEVTYMEEAVKEKDFKEYINGSTPSIYFKDKYGRLFNKTYKALILRFDSDDFKEGLFVIKGELQNSISGSTVLNIDNSIYMLIVEENSIYDKTFFKKLMVEIYQKYEIEGQGIYSEKTYKIEDFYDSFKNLYKFLDYKFMLEENIIIDETDLKKEKGKKYYYPIEIEQRWMNKYVKGNFQGAKSILDEIFSENFQERKIDTKEFETLKILIFNSLKRMGNEGIDKYQEEVLNIKAPFEFKNKILEILKEFEVDLVPKEKGDTVSITAEKIEEFIERNYMKDISLLDLSEHLGVSLQYASNLHKKVKGENFNHYLNSYRIEKSIEILKKDDSVKIKDLAAMVGYINTNTFINNFKKIKGTSPGKYSKK